MKFKVGDKVKVNTSTYNWGEIRTGDIGVIFSITDYSDDIVVDFPKQKQWCCKEKDLELAPKDLDHLEVGDVLVDKYDNEKKVLGVLDDLIFINGGSIDSGYSSFGYTTGYLKEYGYTLKEQPQDTIEIAGKKFLKKDIEQATKDLKPVE